VPVANHNNESSPCLYLALPVMDESRQINRLLESIEAQNYHNFKLFVCVNQPDDWWHVPEKIAICNDNAHSLEILKNHSGKSITLIDKSSPGEGWKGKHQGVGWARKTVMDAINAVASNNDLIVSIDADTWYPPGYLYSLAGNLLTNPDATAFAVPYYHKLTGEERADRAILRYEIYMRYYSLNLWRCNIPYRFTAIGSALAAPVWAYRRIGGITPHMSGEDFYFLLKLAKIGRVVTWNSEMAFPAARFSDRVLFGTGPAMIRGDGGDWSSYPFYDPKQFDLVSETFTSLYNAQNMPLQNQFIGFLNELFKTDDLFAPLRSNHSDRQRFIKACVERIDALRILQYLRLYGINRKLQEEDNLTSYLKDYFGITIPQNFSFNRSTVDQIDEIRNQLAGLESQYMEIEWNRTKN